MKHFSFFPDLPPKKRRLLLIPALILILAAGIFLYRTLPPSSDPDSFFSRSLTSKSENEQFTAFTETLFRQEVSSDTISLHYSLQNPEAYGILDAPVTLGSFPSKSTSFTLLIMGRDTPYFSPSFTAALVEYTPSTTILTSFMASSMDLPCPIR